MSFSRANLRTLSFVSSYAGLVIAIVLLVATMTHHDMQKGLHLGLVLSLVVSIILHVILLFGVHYENWITLLVYLVLHASLNIAFPTILVYEVVTNRSYSVLVLLILVGVWFVSWALVFAYMKQLKKLNPPNAHSIPVIPDIASRRDPNLIGPECYERVDSSPMCISNHR